MSNVIRLHPADNVGVALRELQKGEPLDCIDDPVSVTLRQGIPEAHKVALAAVREGGPITKYGIQIGIATAAIRPGEHVHVHNVVSARIGGTHA
jgi:hypothetical protein